MSFAYLNLLLLCPCRLSAHYRTRGGEWWGRIAETPHFYMLSVVRKGINEWRISTARKLISFEIDSISPGDQSLPAL